MVEPRILWSYRPVTTFFVFQIKKSLSKTTTKKLYPAKKCETNIRNMHKKINVSLIIFTLLVLYSPKFNVHKSWTIYKII